jgi:hypothetical protein
MLACKNVKRSQFDVVVSHDFSENTIYMAFIYFCKFNSLAPIPTYLTEQCKEKPADIDSSESVDTIIQQLKESNVKYDKKQFHSLLKAINQRNIVETHVFDEEVPSLFEELLDFVSLLNSQESVDIEEQGFSKKMLTALMATIAAITAGNEYIETSNDSLNSQLINEIQKTADDLIDYLKKNEPNESDEKTNCDKFILDIRNQTRKLSNDNMNHFYKTCVCNFVNIFPTMMKNNTVPQSIGDNFSANHAAKLKTTCADIYKNLRQISESTGCLLNILNNIPRSCTNLVKLSKLIPANMFDAHTTRLLHEYCLLRILHQIVGLATEKEMIVYDQMRELERIQVITVESQSQENENNQFEEMPVFWFNGDQKRLAKKTAKLICAFVATAMKHQQTMNQNYKEIQTNITKLREKENSRLTSELNAMTHDEYEMYQIKQHMRNSGGLVKIKQRDPFFNRKIVHDLDDDFEDDGDDYNEYDAEYEDDNE